MSEPKSLIHCLTSLTASKRSRKDNNNTSRASTRSRSMPHISPDSMRTGKATSSSNDSNDEYTDSNADPVAIGLTNGDEPSDTNVEAADSSSPQPQSIEKLIDPISGDLDTSNNITDDEKQRQMSGTNASGSKSPPIVVNSNNGSLIFESLLQYLTNQDYNELNSLLALTFINTLINNSGVNEKYIEMMQVKANRQSDPPSSYHESLISKLIGIITKSVESGN